MRKWHCIKPNRAQVGLNRNCLNSLKFSKLRSSSFFRFTEDKDLQCLDKEDALIRFEEHIRSLEREHDEEREREKRKQKRIQRKNREAFSVLLEELKEHQLLTSVSLWKDLFHIINRDDRFHAMLAQPGSTPLDLFKFYVGKLKERLPDDKKIMKEVLKEKNYTVETSTKFEDFKSVSPYFISSILLGVIVLRLSLRLSLVFSNISRQMNIGE